MTEADNTIATLPATPTPEESPATILIVFGLDDADKPHASWFTEADTPLAEKAAGMMRMRILHISDEARQKLAGKLPQGRLFDSGKAFVPFINRTLYDQLDAMGGEVPPCPEEPAESDDLADALGDNAAPATDLANLIVGQVVLTPSDGPNTGWWEAVIKERKGADLFILFWENWPDEPTFVRKHRDLTLLPPVEAV